MHQSHHIATPRMVKSLKDTSGKHSHHKGSLKSYGHEKTLFLSVFYSLF